MKREVYEIDKNGYLVDIHVIEENEKTNHITMDMPQGLHRAIWTGEEWVEDMTQEEIDELNKQPIKEPTEIEILKQEKEILAKSVYDLTTIVELILTGGIA